MSAKRTVNPLRSRANVINQIGKRIARAQGKPLNSVQDRHLNYAYRVATGSERPIRNWSWRPSSVPAGAELDVATIEAIVRGEKLRWE